ncbi:MAG: acetoacetate--CoA ligase [Alphaproteobacteria bacterium]|nr:acetoacetate--CoA ligase [Alphaproteobacteria bacterium]NCQ88641.1 acetoacetate--CoA ligase [Alphaproteobacteria bacterium]NCT06184.1 acetoacetate--CoA ligase [Alphaproteobacteria bacterium]
MPDATIDNQNAPDWKPSRPEGTILYDFMQKMAKKYENNTILTDYSVFFNWSIENLEGFWSEFWDYAQIIGEKGDLILQNPEKMTGSQFFPNGSLNYAQNLLKKRDSDAAMIFMDEKERERTLSYDDLYTQVSLWRQALVKAGVVKGDRVAALMPNMPETIIATLATASLGAIWSSASPDFGVQGILDRFGQIEPKVFIAVDGYYYGGKTIDCLIKIKDVQQTLTTLTQTIIVPFVSDAPDLLGMKNTKTVHELFEGFVAQNIVFEQVPFNHPLFIMFSSGTTGVPKCIVHGHGGTLIQHVKEHRLQCDIRAGDSIFYFTTCGWMMWNWLVTGLASGATLLLYDGNPFYPDPLVLWRFTAKHKATLFGTSAKYIDALKAHDIRPKEKTNLSHLKIITSTGSPLVHESFDYIYEHIKKDVHISSISGGTDIVSCFVLGNPISPVWRGEIQGAGLGLAVDVFDDKGKVLPKGAGSGELVCTRPFPCMPIAFWNDPEGVKYKKAYFEKYDNIWCHGDWIERTHNGGLIIHGRSDATLNPGGVRIGTAEIYRQVEQVPQVIESIAVGQNWDGDVRVILFVILKEGVTLDEALIKEIKTKIRSGASPRHVPAKIIQVSDIPKTKSGKMTELAVKDVIHGRPIQNSEALANPEALALYRELEALKS